MRKKGFGFWVGLWALLPLLTGPAASAEEVNFGFAWIPYGKHAFFYGAREKGFYAKEGFSSVKFVPGRGGGGFAPPHFWLSVSLIGGAWILRPRHLKRATLSTFNDPSILKIALSSRYYAFSGRKTAYTFAENALGHRRQNFRNCRLCACVQ